MLPPVISFVIIEYYSVEDIKGCIVSIKTGCENIPYEIIVSSNSCYLPETQNKLKYDFPEIRWSFNKKNGGFAYAMNQGLKIAEGKYMAIINPDVRIKNGLTSMVEFMQSHPSVGAIAPLIVNKQGIIQDSARTYVSVQKYIWRCIKRVIGHKSSVLEKNMDYAQIQTVDLLWCKKKSMKKQRVWMNITLCMRKIWIGVRESELSDMRLFIFH